MNKKYFYWTAVTVYMLFIAYMSLIRIDKPGEAPSLLKQAFFNFLHIPGYAFLTYLWVKCLGNKELKSLILAGLISVTYGTFIEFVQSFTSYRSASLTDVGSNALGSFTVAFFYFQQKIKAV
jgi:VanZ family protein